MAGMQSTVSVKNVDSTLLTLITIKFIDVETLKLFKK